MSLPGGLEALECGLLTVAQSASFLRAVRDLTPPVQQQVWDRLQARLLSAAQEGVVLPPARLAQSLARWVVRADPAGAQDRRRQVEAQGDASYRRRDDGLGDLFATAIPTPVLQAVLCRIRAAAQPLGSQDDRSAGKRRLDALLDLLLGRQHLPVGDEACGCRPGEAAPCGADVLVHVPLGAALGTTDELAELVGHGPLHPDQLHAVLTSAPRVRVVRVDADGVPVSVDDRAEVLSRAPLDEVRARLRALAAEPPGAPQPRHPFDHHSDGPDAHGSDRRPRIRAGGHPPAQQGRTGCRDGAPPAAAGAGAAVRVAWLRRTCPGVRRRPRPGVAGRGDVRLQRRAALPPAPPLQAAADDQDPRGGQRGGGPIRPAGPGPARRSTSRPRRPSARSSTPSRKRTP